MKVLILFTKTREFVMTLLIVCYISTIICGYKMYQPKAMDPRQQSNIDFLYSIWGDKSNLL